MDELLDRRREELSRRKTLQKELLRRNTDLKFTRDKLLFNVSMVLVRHIKDAELLIKRPSEAALLFHEHSFNRHEWNVSSSRGYSATIPLFYFDFHEIPYRE